MRKNEFLEELQHKLNGLISPSELKDIVNDYEELFEEGLREGRTEQEVCRELGSPAQAANSLLQEIHPVQSSSGPSAAGVLTYAPISSRMAAAIVDHVLAVFPLAFFGVLSVLPFMILWPPIFLFYAVEVPPSTGMIAGAMLSAAYYMLYQPLFLTLMKGRTPGKALLQLRVVNRSGEPPGLSHIWGRELLGKILVGSATFGLSNLASFIWCLLSKEHKTVHDAIAGTRVVASPVGRIRE